MAAPEAPERQRLPGRPETGGAPTASRRILWFIGLWAAGVGATVLVAGLLRLLIPR
ncbi:hypothetical protein JYK14_27585 [Siccirubricoccus sp. KC 17139]|uniref:DUF2474 domain-containing protein n=1 Tax=Siccirubricoccus soli TaxID=2899147 RepID=A0ABT1DFB1_9PROT|nr:hypothetical protein [Siccirubricoccus soli]MCO6419894.1 hypothetical protein [Siccirubricoccus soli]MCP2686029.1 hypothetical protein [Siccirubricoccus soli]